VPNKTEASEEAVTIYFAEGDSTYIIVPLINRAFTASSSDAKGEEVPVNVRDKDGTSLVSLARTDVTFPVTVTFERNIDSQHIS